MRAPDLPGIGHIASGDRTSAPGAEPRARPPGRFAALLTSPRSRRARWGMVDQGVSSVTNVVVALVAAHKAGPRAFGAFSVAFSVYLFLAWIARSLVAEPFVVRLTPALPAAQREAARSALGASMTFGAVAGALVALAGVLAGSTLGTALVITGLFLPGLLAQDCYRYILMASGRTRAAAVNDAVWLVVESAGVAVLLLAGRADVATLLVALGASAVAAALVGFRQTGVAPSFVTAARWVRSQRDLAVPFALEYVTVNGMTQLTLLGVAAVVDVVAVGQIRAATLLMSPPTVLFAGAFLVGIPEGVRLREEAPARLRSLVVVLTAATSAITLAWAALMLVLPDQVGTALLGSNWSNGRSLLVPVAAITVGNACALSAAVGLRALEAGWAALRVRVWAAPVILAAGLVGGAVGAGRGAGFGMAAGTAVSGLLGWLAFRRALRRHAEAIRP